MKDLYYSYTSEDIYSGLRELEIRNINEDFNKLYGQIKYNFKQKTGEGYLLNKRIEIYSLDNNVGVFFNKTYYIVSKKKNIITIKKKDDTKTFYVIEILFRNPTFMYFFDTDNIKHQLMISRDYRFLTFIKRIANFIFFRKIFNFQETIIPDSYNGVEEDIEMLGIAAIIVNIVLIPTDYNYTNMG